MKIVSSSMLLSGASSSVELQTKDESLKLWVGNTRPTFPGETQADALGQQQGGFLADSLTLSQEGKAALEKQLASASTCGTKDNCDIYDYLSAEDEGLILLLEKMIHSLTGKRLKFVLPKRLNQDNNANQNKHLQALSQSLQTPQQPQRAGWGLEYDYRETNYEKQTMSFSAEGRVTTADGREINLNLDLNLSREFYSSTNLSLRAGDAVKIDPLVINFNSPSAELTSNRYSFDIDADGIEDQISFVKDGSGFLALDLNNDGIINNGNELFGPKSGNGFSDLSFYDEDGNGWIDENDDIYNKLRIWTKDENGNDRLFALGVKGIGAIFLGSVNTAYDIRSNDNKTLGSIARSGIYLKESGIAGTIQHVDLAI